MNYRKNKCWKQKISARIDSITTMPLYEESGKFYIAELISRITGHTC